MITQKLHNFDDLVFCMWLCLVTANHDSLLKIHVLGFKSRIMCLGLNF